ncbi:MAG TPA: iron-containing redox enzyme family protein [Candidatus Binatia bacterium]
MSSVPNGIDQMWRTLVQMANDQFDSPPFKRLLNTKFTHQRAQHYSIQMAHYVKNRRDCWGYVQGGAPLDVKRLIWEHEEDELIGRKSEGKDDHITLAVKEGAVFGLSATAFDDTPILEGGVACFYSWLHLAQRPWLEAIASSAILEIRNSAELIEGGSLSRHIAEKFERELGIPMKKQINNAEHVVMDVEHAHLLMRVAEKYAMTEVDQNAIIKGARESLVIDRVYRAHLADMLERLP